MCLTLTEDSARLRRNFRRRKNPIIAYKVLFDFGEKGIFSEYKDYEWKSGCNVSDRDGTHTTAQEKVEIGKGFHFFLDKEAAEEYYRYRCRYPNLCRYRCPCRCPCQYRYRCQYRYFKVVELQVDPKDVVAVGVFDSKKCVVATKATLV